jgi:hypothetical protein
MRRAPLVTVIFMCLTALGVAQQPPVRPAPRDPQRELAMSAADGFTVAAVGDCIIARPVSQTSGFAPVGKLVRDADVAFGNFEGTAIDLTRTPATPQAEFGGVWIIGTPAVARDLKAIGFDVMSRANNHATDWGLEGMRQTSRALDEAGIVHAGVGENRASARGARYVDSDKGRVALVSLASTFTPLSRSAPPVGQAPGRPGVSALRTTRYSLVTPEELRALRKIRDEQPAGSVRLPEKEPADELDLFGVRYKAADHRGFAYTIDPVDEREVLKLTTTRFERGRLAEIRLHPVDLNYAARGADRGVPRPASSEVAQTILQRMQRLSEPFGTRITIDGNVGVIRPSGAPATAARP